MNPLTLWHRGYFLIVAGFTSWVGYIGFIRPTEILRALSWPVPPLHARSIGTLYLSATEFLLLSLFARSWLQVRIIVQIAFIWTGWLLLITVLAALCFVLPNRVSTIWPWKISSFLAQVYSGPLLGYGMGGLILARRGNWTESWIPMVGLLSFAVLAILGSLQHLALFNVASASTVIWFGALAMLALGSVSVLI